MTFNGFTFHPLCAALLLASMLTACSGGGGSSVDTFAGTTGGNSSGSSSSSSGSSSSSSSSSGGSSAGSGTLLMRCPEGTGVQCSGSTLLGSENGVAYTASGVQVYGRSTSDLATPILDITTPTGLERAAGGFAEFRIGRNASGNPVSPIMLLRNLGISWDGTKERPLIIEPFLPTAGRSMLEEDGTINTGLALPPSSDIGFYNFATLGLGATQENYGNNRYFPRASPARCDVSVTNCPAVETTGVRITLGDWRTGGSMADVAEASRLHEDGDVHAGDGSPNSNGPSVPSAGGKGYRALSHWSYGDVNLGTWVTADTVNIVEWRPGQPVSERAQIRRGAVAYGNVTPPYSMPTTGKVGYFGTLYGWYAPTRTGGEPDFVSAKVILEVDFASRVTSVRVQNVATYNALATPVAVDFTAVTALGTGDRASYFTGPAVSGALTGGVSGRFFGPVGSETGSAPSEIGGAVSLASPTGATLMGGFLGRRMF